MSRDSNIRAYLPGLILVLLIQSALSIVTTWNNSGNNWNAAGNWSSGVPGSGDEARFNTAVTHNPVVNSPSNAGQLNFVTGAGTYTISSSATANTLTIHGISGNLITNSSGNTQNINAHLILANSGNITATSGNLNFNSSVGFNLNSYTATISGSSNVTIASNITGTGSIVKNGTNTLTLSGNNTSTFTLTVNNGTVDLNTNSTSANTSLVLNNGTVNINDDLIIGSLSGTGGVLNTNTWTPAIGGNNASTTFSGTITGDGGLIKQGSGTLTLSGPQNYTNATQVDAGTLVFLDSSDTSAVTVNNTGTLILDNTGRLPSAGGVTLNPGGTLLITATNTSSDRISDTANVILAGGTLINLDNTPETVGFLTLTDHSTISLSTVSGNNSGWIFDDFLFYDGIANGNTFNPTLTIANSTAAPYTSAGTNDKIIFNNIGSVPADFLANVVWSSQGLTGATFIPFGSAWELVPIPEPSTYAAILLLIIFGTALHFRRLQQRQTAPTLNQSGS